MFQVGEPISSTNPMPVDLGGASVSINGVTSPALSELTFVDVSTKQFVVRRTVLKPDGTFAVTFVDLVGNTVAPTASNLALPVSVASDGTVTAVGSGGLMTLSLSQYTAW